MLASALDEPEVSMRDSNRGLCLSAALTLLVVVCAGGCGTPAKAEPLELTYYYLPG